MFGDALIAAYQQADALLFPSRLEGLPLTVLEAQACGLPVIAARASSLPEVVEEGVTGLLCSQNDIQAFVDTARQLAGEFDLWLGMRTAARQRTENRFCLDAMVDRYSDLYRSILAKSIGERASTDQRSNRATQ